MELDDWIWNSPRHARTPSSFALGTGGSFARLDDGFLRRALDSFWEAGQRVIDTAPDYWEGEAERILGRLLSPTRRQSAYIITKVWHEPTDTERTFSAASLRSEIQQSLTRLRTDHVASVLLHRDPGLPSAQVAEAMTEACAGLARSWGTSNFSGDRLHQLLDERKALASPAMNSAQLSIVPLDRPLHSGTTIYSGNVELCHRTWQLPLLAWGAQARGWLSSRSEFETKKFESANNRLLRQRVHETAARSACSPEAVSLQWVVERDIPSLPIVGLSHGPGLSNALAAMQHPVSRGDMEVLSAFRTTLADACLDPPTDC